MGFSIRTKGNYRNLRKFLDKASNTIDMTKLTDLAEQGLRALRDATPIDSGLTAASWGYTLQVNDGGVKIIWTNSNVVNGVPIAVILDSGHGTGTGGYVEGLHYIDPAVEPVFDELLTKVWKELKK